MKGNMLREVGHGDRQLCHRMQLWGIRSGKSRSVGKI